MKNVTFQLKMNCIRREQLKSGTSVEEARLIVAQNLGISPNEVIDNAETAEEISSRQHEFLQLIYRDVISSNTQNTFEIDHSPQILVVSHGGFIKRFLNFFCGIKLEKIKNCSVSTVEVTFSNDGSFQCRASEDRVNLKVESSESVGSSTGRNL
jgi:broad specificity phosphatase PhoE